MQIPAFHLSFLFISLRFLFLISLIFQVTLTLFLMLSCGFKEPGSKKFETVLWDTHGVGLRETETMEKPEVENLVALSL
jgi:hypothetical protein